MYPKEAQYTVFCPTCWWSDKWSYTDYARDVDFSRPFLEQVNELLHKVPLIGLAVNANTLVESPYNNYTTYAKDTYLTFNSDNVQECAYGASITRSRESFDSSMVMDCDSVYDCMCIYKSNMCIGTRGNNRFCIDCASVRDCENCQDCLMCSGLKSKKYCFKNVQYTKEEYQKIRESYDLGSHRDYMRAQKEAEDFYQSVPPRPSWDTLSVNCSGSYVFHSKNCIECYDIGDSEDCKYCMMLWRSGQKNCYDTTLFGGSIENIYEGMNIFENSSRILFSAAVGLYSSNVEYSYLSMGGQNLFGCVGTRKAEYSILNKKYSKEEYYSLVEKIKTHMTEMSYADSFANIYGYGEFFPLSVSPFPYNMSFAQLFFPLSEEEIRDAGFWFLPEEERNYTITKSSEEIPEHIKDVDQSFLAEVFECRDCKKGYKVIEKELFFLKKMNVPFPRVCPFCRIKSKLHLWVDNMNLKDRTCAVCSKTFKTHFGENRAQLIYCIDCYKKEYR